MRAIVKTLMAIAFALILVPAMAQPPKKTPAKTPVQKFKLPKLTTQLGARSDSVEIAIEEALQLIKFPLKVTDDKKTVYPVTSYQFVYRRKEITEDENTGKTSPTSSIIADHFDTTPLPAIWVTSISERLKSGEELFFYDIVVKDATGRLMFAPTLKIKVVLAR